MNISTIKYELQNILSGKSEVSHGESIQAITCYLRESIGTSEETKKNESNKSEETKKLNDAIYYASWVDYFNNLLLNNYFFPDTAYNLVGFYKSDTDVLYALVEQNYIESTEATDLSQVQEFMQANGFDNTRNNDYFHPELGIILEDLHDENVLTAHEILYFIDTVFYIKPEIFWH